MFFKWINKLLPWHLPLAIKCLYVCQVPLILDIKAIEFLDTTNHTLVANEFLFEVQSHAKVG